MSFDQSTLSRTLGQLSELAGKPDRFVVAFSGGLDSTVLLHALAAARDDHRTGIVAVYVDHGLHAESARWGDHCAGVADALGVDFVRLTVAVDPHSGKGVEAASRAARYGAFRSFLRRGDWLLSAHHKDDQAETLLLNLMRGSGPAGLAGIGDVLPLAAGWLVRPLLSVARSELQTYATDRELDWIDDPSNEDRQFDRNYLRHEVLPLLEARWPGAAGRLERSAQLAGEAAQLLDQLGDADCRELGTRPDRLALGKLRELPAERQRNVLRYVIRELGLPAVPATQLQSVITDLIPARGDAQPVVQWPGAEIRRYRDCVYVLAADVPDAASAAVAGTEIGPDGGIALGPGRGELVLEPGAPLGLADAVIRAGLELRYRKGGEEIKPIGQTHRKKIKKLLQDEGVVPWMRNKLPLLYSDGRLVAVADLWLADQSTSEPGTAIRWRNRPPLH